MEYLADDIILVDSGEDMLSHVHMTTSATRASLLSVRGV